MAALLILPPLSYLSRFSSSSSPLPDPLQLTAAQSALASRFQGVRKRNLPLRLGSGNGLGSATVPCVSGRRKVMIRASSEIDGGAPSSSSDAPKEEGENSISVENLPLETKLQLRLEQKLRMKLARKIRLRRKRLVRKRRMRKKGRWPPSKMKKNKNV